MKDFCRGCPDKRDEGCALPNRGEVASARLRLIGLNASTILGVGAAMSGNTSGMDVILDKIKDAEVVLAEQRNQVAQCIDLHQMGVQTQAETPQ